MDVIRTIKPGEHGSRKLQREYGDKLLVVRYRKSSDGCEIHTTVELIVDTRKAPDPVFHAKNAVAHSHAGRDEAVVAVKVGYQELQLRNRLKAVGARWSRSHKVWVTYYRHVGELGISDRVVPGLAEKCSDIGVLW